MANEMGGSKPFEGVLFVLLGFDYDSESEVRQKLVGGGGEDAGSYGPDCTHVIIDKCVYDDPTCVAARIDGKILVTALWVDHSYDIGMPVDHTTVIYRPMKDLDGIPGAKDLVICLTGYQRQDREDIMIMVSLMGAEFSKPLVASRATHLICYKFEGEKYELAKKLPQIKIVNHTWLEDCLSSWELLPEENYAKSGYDLEMEAEVQDSEEENDCITKQFNGTNNNVSFDTRVRKGAVLTLSGAHSIPKVSLTPAATIEIGNTEKSKGLTKNNVAKITLAVFGNKIDSAIDGSSSKDVLKHEYCNQSVEFGVRNGLETVCPNIVENSEYPVPSPWKENNNNASGDPSCSIGSAKEFPDNFLKGSNTAHAMKISQTLSSRKDLSDMTRYSDEQSGRLVDSDPLASISKIGLTGERGNVKTSVLRKEVLVNVLPSKRKKDDTYDSFTAPENGQSSGSPIVGTDNTELAPTEQSPGISGVNLNARNLINSLEPITVLKQKPDTVTSSPVLMPEKYEDPHIAKLPTGGRQGTKSTLKKKDVSKKISGSRLSFKAGSPCSGIMKADDQTNFNLMRSENQDPKSKPGKRKGSVKKVTESNLTSEAPSHDGEFKKPKEPDLLVEENAKPIAEPPKNKINNDSVGTRLKTVAKAISKKCSYTVTENSSAEASNGDKKSNMHDAFPKPSDTKTVSSAEDALELERVESFGIIKDFEGAFQPKGDETEYPGRKNELVANTTVVIEDKEIKSYPLLTDYNSENNTDSPLSYPAFVEGKVNGIFLEDELDRGAVTTTAKRDKTKRETKNYTKSKKEAKTTAGIKKITHGCSDRVTAVNKDQAEAETETRDERTLQMPNSSAVKHTDDALRLKNVLDSKNETILLDYADGGNRNETIFHLPKGPNINTQNLAVDINQLKNVPESEKENTPLPVAAKNTSLTKERALNTIPKSDSTSNTGKRKTNAMQTYATNKVTSQKFIKNELKFFLLSGHRSQRNELRKIVRQLKGRICRDSHHWSYQATHFIVPEPVRTEKFFAAAASGRWILRPDYLTDSLKAGKFLDEEPYEWYSNDPGKVGRVDLVAPRKWRILREQTGHGAFHGMCIIVYGDFFCPPLDTLKRVVKAGDGIILATAPPYTRFLHSQIDFAVISQGMPKVDVWVQEFLKHEIPCVAIDYLVEFVCKPCSPPQKEHVMFETHPIAEKSYASMLRRSEEIIKGFTVNDEEDLKCNVCGSGERGEQILICRDEKGSVGCGIGTHLDCCDPPLQEIPEDDWLCSKCSISNSRGIKKSKSDKTKKKPPQSRNDNELHV